MSDEESIGDIDGGADEELDGVFEDADDEAAPVGDSDDEIEPGETPLPAATQLSPAQPSPAHRINKS
jgi:hypothetical protein